MSRLLLASAIGLMVLAGGAKANFIPQFTIDGNMDDAKAKGPGDLTATLNFSALINNQRINTLTAVATVPVKKDDTISAIRTALVNKLLGTAVKNGNNDTGKKVSDFYSNFNNMDFKLTVNGTDKFIKMAVGVPNVLTAPASTSAPISRPITLQGFSTGGGEDPAGGYGFFDLTGDDTIGTSADEVSVLLSEPGFPDVTDGLREYSLQSYSGLTPAEAETGICNAINSDKGSGFSAQIVSGQCQITGIDLGFGVDLFLDTSDPSGVGAFGGESGVVLSLVPEPRSWLLLAAAVLGMVLCSRQ